MCVFIQKGLALRWVEPEVKQSQSQTGCLAWPFTFSFLSLSLSFLSLPLCLLRKLYAVCPNVLYYLLICFISFIYSRSQFTSAFCWNWSEKSRISHAFLTYFFFIFGGTCPLLPAAASSCSCLALTLCWQNFSSICQALFMHYVDAPLEFPGAGHLREAFVVLAGYFYVRSCLSTLPGCKQRGKFFEIRACLLTTPSPLPPSQSCLAATSTGGSWNHAAPGSGTSEKPLNIHPLSLPYW